MSRGRATTNQTFFAGERDRFRAMSLAPRQKCPRNVVEMKEAMAAFFGSDNVAISCHCHRKNFRFPNWEIPVNFPNLGIILGKNWERNYQNWENFGKLNHF